MGTIAEPIEKVGPVRKRSSSNARSGRCRAHRTSLLSSNFAAKFAWPYILDCRFDDLYPWEPPFSADLSEYIVPLKMVTKVGDFFIKTDLDLELLLSTSSKNVLLLGNPGYGKTTFCSQLAFDWATKILRSNSRRLSSLFVLYHLKDYKSGSFQDALLEFLASFTQFGSKEVTKCLEELHQDGTRIVFALDGYDELDHNRKEALREFLSNRGRMFSNSLVLVTCRTTCEDVYQQTFDETYKTKGFTLEGIRSYVNKLNAEEEDLKTTLVTFRKKVCSGKVQSISPLCFTSVCDAICHAFSEPDGHDSIQMKTVGRLVKRWNVRNNRSLDQETLELLTKTFDGLLTTCRESGTSELSESELFEQLGQNVSFAVESGVFEFTAHKESEKTEGTYTLKQPFLFELENLSNSVIEGMEG